jgi:hypothetical protein
VLIIALTLHNVEAALLTRRQREILDLLTRCHAVAFHPSPAHLATLVGIGGERAIRTELGRLIIAGEIDRVEVGSGSAPNRYGLKACPCAWCAPPPAISVEPYPTEP